MWEKVKKEKRKKLKLTMPQIVAAVTALIFILALPIAIFIGSEYRKYFNEYLVQFNESQRLEGILREERDRYFYDLVQNELINLKNGSKVIYNKIKGLYNYKLYVNGKPVSGSSLEIYEPNFVLTLEESFEQETDLAPRQLLKSFSYFLSKGQGGQPVSVDEIIRSQGDQMGRIGYISSPNCVYDIDRDESFDYMVRINIDVSQIGDAREFWLLFDKEFMQKFNIEDPLGFTVRYVGA